MNRIELDRRWKVLLETTIDLPLPAATVWDQLADFRRFACMDLFHERVALSAPAPAAGVSFALEHRFLGVRVTRTGRILRWQDGRGYAFSDLSTRNPTSGFPHIYSMDITPTGQRRCQLGLRVSGRWTARFLGRTITRIWLGWVFLKIRYSTENALLASAEI